MSENSGHTRYFSPAQEFKSFLLNDNLKHLLCLISLELILWEEKHTDTVLSLIAKLDAKGLCNLDKKAVTDLNQNTYTVACLSFSVLTCSVL